MTDRSRPRRHTAPAVVLVCLGLVAAGCSGTDETHWTETLTDGAVRLFTGGDGATPAPPPADAGGDLTPLGPGEIEVSGEPLPLFEDGPVDPAVGMPAPEVWGAGFEGEQVAIVHAGRPKAILFLAHWCPHCQNEVPRVQAWLDSGGGVPGVDIVSVATAIEPNHPNFPPSDWLDREGWTSPVIVDDDDWTAFESYGRGGFPYWVFLDARGRVVRRTAGELDIADLEQFLREIVANA